MFRRSEFKRFCLLHGCCQLLVDKHGVGKSQAVLASKEDQSVQLLPRILHDNSWTAMLGGPLKQR